MASADRLSCSQLGEQIRSIVGKYDKTKVFNLPVTNAAVTEAIGRSKSNFVDTAVLPTQLQTAVHRIIEDLVSQSVINIPQ